MRPYHDLRSCRNNHIVPGNPHDVSTDLFVSAEGHDPCMDFAHYAEARDGIHRLWEYAFHIAEHAL